MSGLLPDVTAPLCAADLPTRRTHRDFGGAKAGDCAVGRETRRAKPHVAPQYCANGGILPRERWEPPVFSAAAKRPELFRRGGV
jgi:hypothetical protein